MPATSAAVRFASHGLAPHLVAGKPLPSEREQWVQGEPSCSSHMVSLLPSTARGRQEAAQGHRERCWWTHPSPGCWRAAWDLLSLLSLEQPWLLPSHPNARAALARLLNPTSVPTGSGSASSQPRAGLPAARCDVLRSFVVAARTCRWQELPFTLWGISNARRRKCQREGKGLVVLPTCPCLDQHSP